ncbi:hypothetical protein LOTGIDRAFT_95897, partial [Lottia gigantea]
FRVMQWNMLAQALSQGTDNFVKCPAEALSWDNRKLHIMEEILTHNPTILCLQEVDQFNFLEKELGKVGYKGTFCKKPFSPCLDITPNFGPDGCAVFWKTSEVKEVKVENYIIKQKENYDTNQICILCCMKLKNIDSDIFVAVTHLKAKKYFNELRKQQSQFIAKLLQEKCKNSPVILCGDFNADPQELAYKEMVTKDLNLNSAYTFLDNLHKEPAYTTLKIRGSPVGPLKNSATIDYIFFSLNHLKVTSLVRLPSEEEIGEDCLPSFTFPSDHLSLIADFHF